MAEGCQNLEVGSGVVPMSVRATTCIMPLSDAGTRSAGGPLTILRRGTPRTVEHQCQPVGECLTSSFRHAAGTCSHGPSSGGLP